MSPRYPPIETNHMFSIPIYMTIHISVFVRRKPCQLVKFTNECCCVQMIVVSIVDFVLFIRSGDGDGGEW